MATRAKVKMPANQINEMKSWAARLNEDVPNASRALCLVAAAKGKTYAEALALVRQFTLDKTA